MSCEGRTVFITGGNGGIGRALTAACLDAGARLVLAGCRTATPAPGNCRHVPLDVTDAASVAAAASAWAGQVDILINNAGVNHAVDLFADGAAEAMVDEFRVNALGLMQMTRAFAGPMATGEERAIVNILSVLSRRSVPAMASYCASKAAALSLAESVRILLEPQGVRVMNVFPRMIDTPMSANLDGPKMSAPALAHAILAGLAGNAEDLFP